MILEQKIKSYFEQKYPHERTNPGLEDCYILYNGPHGLLVMTKSVKGCVSIGYNSVWCVSDPNDSPEHVVYHHEDYLPGCFFRDPDGELYAWSVDVKTGRGKFNHMSSNQFLGIKKQTIRLIPPVAEVFEMIEDHVLTDPAMAYKYAISMIQERWPKGERVIAKDEKIFKKYLIFLRRKKQTLEENQDHNKPQYFWAWLNKKYIMFKWKMKSFF